MTQPSAHTTELIGFVAAFCTTTAFIPQLARVLRLRSAREISLPTFLLFSIGVFLWLLYGIYDHSGPVIASNTVTLVLSLSILFLKIRYDRNATRAIPQDVNPQDVNPQDVNRQDVNPQDVNTQDPTRK